MSHPAIVAMGDVVAHMGCAPGRVAIAAPEETAALARAASGNPDAFAWLLARYRSRILRLAFTVLRDSDLAEDAAQECFIRAFRGIRSFRGPDGFYPWLCRIVIRACSDVQRRNRRDQSATREPASEANPDVACVRRLAVEALIERLSPPMRAALVMREMDGLDYEEIARALGVPIGTVRSRLHAARSQFRDLYLAAMREEERVR